MFMPVVATTPLMLFKGQSVMRFSLLHHRFLPVTPFAFPQTVATQGAAVPGVRVGREGIDA